MFLYVPHFVNLSCNMNSGSLYISRGEAYNVVSAFRLLFLPMHASPTAQIYLTYTFLTDEPLHWNASQYSFLQGVSIAVEGLALLVILPLAYRYLGITDALAGLLGSISRCLALLWLGLCTTTTMVYFSEEAILFAAKVAKKLLYLVSHRLASIL